MTDTLVSNECKIRPAYETSENADAYEVRVFMPGVGKDGIGISLENDELRVSGRRSASIPEGWRPLSRESRGADYQLRLGLNVKIDGEKIEARNENGVLILTLPKAEALKFRKIPVL
ncbi:MAG: Hsp20/alpha crystallin family protein [Opitutales bacterium]|jgi:HSP20 family molecular chaperone IbpA